MNRQDRMIAGLGGGNRRPDRQDTRTALRGGADPRRLQSAGPGSLQYREDVGYRMSDEQYAAHQERYTEWDNQLSDYEAQLGAAQGKIDEQVGKLNKEYTAREKEIDDAKARLDEAANTTMSSLWSKEKGGYTNVRVVDPSGDKIEGTYRVPKAYITGHLQGIGQRYSWVDNNQNFNLSVVNNEGKIRGAEVHKLMRDAESSLKESFYEKNLPAYTTSRQEIADGYKDLNEARYNLISSYETALGTYKGEKSDIQGKQAEIDFARTDYEDTVASAKEDYEKKRALRRGMLGGYNG